MRLIAHHAEVHMASSCSRLGALLVGGVFLTIACHDAPDPTSPNVQSSNPQFLQVSQNPNPSQLEVAQAVPGFGGYFLDGSGVPSVYLLDASERPAAEQALAGFLADRGFTASDLRVLQGQYEYVQLDQWYRQVRGGVFSVAGIVLGDVDEGSNRLRFGVGDVGAVTGVRSVLALAGIPISAALVQQRAPFRTVATLRDRVRPIIGGLQINFFLTPPGIHPGSFICTLGFNAVRFGITSFITNSHCTNVEGAKRRPPITTRTCGAAGPPTSSVRRSTILTDPPSSISTARHRSSAATATRLGFSTLRARRLLWAASPGWTR
jgi:hypothetical protein